MIESGRKVTIHYIGTLDDGTVFDSSLDRGIPLEFIVGTHQVVTGLDQAVSEMSVGETKKVRITAQDAYGTYDESLIEAVPTAALPNVEGIPLGESIVLTTPSGQLRVKALKIEDDYVYFDHNHELADKDLNFEITILEVSDETADSDVGND